MPMGAPMFPQGGPASQAAAPSGNPGEQAAAMATIRQASKILEMALPKLDIASEQYKAAVDALRTLAKAFPEQEEAPGVQTTALLGLQREAREGAMMRQLMMQGQQQQAPQEQQMAQA